MNPTSDEFEPRRDNWYEHDATWGEVVIGTVLADPKGRRTPRWEVIGLGHGAQVRDGHTLWMRIRDQISGAEHSVQPRPKTSKVIILTQDPRDTETGPIVPTEDGEAILRVIETLGASHLATRDEITGEIHCPNYAFDYSIGMEGELEHLRFAHGIDTSQFNDLGTDDFVRAVVTTHGRAHNPAHPEIGKGGFPHRHVPEDLSILTGKRS